jgi:NAD(P)-dependent dehydrogenase (short-subunit alcohol dehydrogenase family)
VPGVAVGQKSTKDTLTVVAFTHQGTLDPHFAMPTQELLFTRNIYRALVRALAPAMKARRSGRIVNFASIATRRGSERVGVHCAAAKGGIVGLTKTLALEPGPHGITVNAIAPGCIDTERMAAVAWGRRTPAAEKTLLDSIPLGRLGRPDEVARVCSHAGGYVSDATIDVNGGLYFGP